MPVPWVTSILPNPVRNASLTTTALVPVGPGPVWAAAMPAVAAVTPPARTAATTARAVQDIPRGPPARRKVNLIDATASFSRNIRPQPGITYAARCPVHHRAGPAGERPERPQLSG